VADGLIVSPLLRGAVPVDLYNRSVDERVFEIRLAR
jgi:hypothetical protein